ncbi:S9 family peptidase [archaeon]|nr:MAG: S9 family peptidase [archaeon]
MSNQKKRHITAEDLYQFNLISEPQISPDGKLAAYCLRRADKETEKLYSNLWLVPTNGRPARQFTYGSQSDTHPRFSPDGSQIAFLSNRDDEKQPQIYLIPLKGGEARPITDLKGTIKSFEWSPDGTKLLLQFRKKDAEEIIREADEKKKELGIVCRQVTRVFFKEDGVGFLPKGRWHALCVDVDSEKIQQFTEDDAYDTLDPHWSPDGKQVTFCSNHKRDPDLDPDAIDLYVFSVKDGTTRKIETPVGPKGNPAFSPDGSLIAYYGHEGKGQNWKETRLWVIPASGDGNALNLTKDYDFDVSSWTINDMGDLPQVAPMWSTDGKRIYFQVAHHGNTVLKSVSLKGEVADVISDEGVVGRFAFDNKQQSLLYFHANMQDPGQVYLRKLTTNRSRVLTHANKDLLNELDLGKIEEVWFKGASGNDLQGWILTPPGFDPAKKYPSILEIHGGPLVQYGNFFMHEFYYLAAQGYVVYFCNPRGGQGYGEQHAKAICNNWGTADYEDVMAWADYLEKKPYIDSSRMGVTGGSYGGYMTNWIIGHTNRFSAAVTQRSVSNLISMYGSSDFNWAFQEEFSDLPPWEDLENYWRQSPMKYIGDVTTPTLVIHSEQDLRCAIEQDEQVFVALKRLGVDTEMIRFPDEPHGLSRKGRTDRRIARLEHICRWFDRYLKKDTNKIL